MELQVSPFSRRTHFSFRSCSLRPPSPKCPLTVPSSRTPQQDLGLASPLSKMPEMSQPVRLQANLIQGQGVSWHELLQRWDWLIRGVLQKCTTVSCFSERANEILQENIFCHGNIKKTTADQKPNSIHTNLSLLPLKKSYTERNISPVVGTSATAQKKTSPKMSVSFTIFNVLCFSVNVPQRQNTNNL